MEFYLTSSFLPNSGKVEEETKEPKNHHHHLQVPIQVLALITRPSGFKERFNVSFFTSNSIFSSATSTKSRKSSCCSIETASTATTTTTTNKSKTSSNAIPMPISSTSLTQPRSLSRKPTNSSDSHSINL